MRRFRFKPEPTGLRTELGDLERTVMKALWQHGVCTVSQVHHLVSRTHKVALTTIATTLVRLGR